MLHQAGAADGWIHSTYKQVEFLGMQQACVNACVPSAGANESSGTVGMNRAMLLTSPPAGPISPGPSA